ncbi:MAG: hypothetical protein LBB93_05545 [Elusimicrobiota bacterium]|jgi:hypothetical protein|nr:hypothetical protein [Elusimicrobiota bacterium]
MSLYICKYFKIKELVNPAYLSQASEVVLWGLFDDRLLKAADGMRTAGGCIDKWGRGWWIAV